MLIPLLRDAHGFSAVEVGWMLTATAAASLIAAAFIGRLLDAIGGFRLLALAILSSGVLLMLLSQAVIFAAAIPVIMVNGFMSAIVCSVYTGERQRRVPQDLQSLVGITGRMLMMACAFVGAVVMGGLSARVSVPTAFFVTASGVLLAGGLAWLGLVRHDPERTGAAAGDGPREDVVDSAFPQGDLRQR